MLAAPCTQADADDQRRDQAEERGCSARRGHVEAPLKMPVGRAQQHHHEDHERHGELVLGRHQRRGPARQSMNGQDSALKRPQQHRPVEHRQRLGKADEEAAGDGAIGLPEPAHDRRREDRQDDVEGEVGLQLHVERQHVPASRRAPPAMSQVTRTTSCVLMPETCARSALSAMARIALPSRERVRNRRQRQHRDERDDDHEHLRLGEVIGQRLARARSMLEVDRVAEARAVVEELARRCRRTAGSAPWSISVTPIEAISSVTGSRAARRERR